MKYIVITSKHHDGFALFDSKVTKWDVVDATPFKRDILKELSAACQKHGMPLGFYYSQAQDWHEPGGAGNDWDFGPDLGPDGKERKDYDAYLRGKAEPQVRELLTGYGPVALIWFDTPRMMTRERGQRFVDLVRSLQPKTLIDGRLGVAGDYVSTGDNFIPGTAPADAWEVPATINHTWGFRKRDHAAGQGLRHALRGAAAAVHAPADAQRGQARVPAGRRRAGRGQDGRRPHVAQPRPAHPRPHGHGGGGRDRGGRRQPMRRRRFLGQAGATAVGALAAGRPRETSAGAPPSPAAAPPASDREYCVDVARRLA